MTDTTLRLDKWLWAARFFKTRALASDAVSGGKVHLNAHRVKPGKVVQPGDSLSIQLGVYTYEVTVLAIHKQRRPASEARLLYEESAPSVRKRELIAEQLSLAAQGRQLPDHKPNKHERGQIIRFKRRQSS